jgi:Fe-S-cluster-containing dehydrogenase component
MSPLTGKTMDGGEFARGASEWPDDLSRREFLRLMAASLALAGLGGCARETPRKIVSRVTPPIEGTGDGATRWFATAMPIEGFARGILVRTNSGRPTKIEGNPDHPESLGATDVFTQAAILSLYDPDRSPVPRRNGEPATWAAFDDEFLTRRRQLVDRRGAGLALLLEPTTSPTLRREIGRVLDVFPEARWFQHTPLVRHDREGEQWDFDFSQADLILTIQSDCFYQHPAAVRYGRTFATRRRVESGRVSPPRFYALETTPTVTGTLADFRLPVSPTRLRAVLDGIAQAISGQPAKATLQPGETALVRALATDIAAHRGRVACVCGPQCATDLRAWADSLNASAGTAVARRLPAVRSDGDPRSAGDLAALRDAAAAGQVNTLLVLGSNPAYTAPADVAFPEWYRHISFRLHLGEHVDETAALSSWHLPESHFLETWSDLRGYDGAATILQPVVEPFHATRSAVEILRLLSGLPVENPETIVRQAWRDDQPDFDAHWNRWLERGLVDEPSSRAPAAAATPTFPSLATSSQPDSITVVFASDPNVSDGRWANNAWLQELPKPLTKLVWENAALVSPGLAADHVLENGDIIQCEIAGRSLDLPVWIMPGHASDSVTVTLGYGRTAAGRVGNGRGYNAFLLRTQAAPWETGGATIRSLGRKQTLICTQGHFTMEGRDLVKVVTPKEAGQPVEPNGQLPSLYPEWRGDRYAWGMAIDLSTCLGCNACVVACQAENNIPVVGKEQVARGREMHWLRIDRYVSGDPANPVFLPPQPIPCMHCENAPCEVVCPVAATVHSSEGLNDMVYNRCIGTRYCSNNCPYKVRRFNFLDYRSPRESPVYLQANPDVTIRERGVMEKCTYCVQRINAARITAEKEGRAIRDGEVKTACQQACPAEAIVFGNLNDPASRASRRKAEPTNYSLLAELNTRPRTTYLAGIRQEDHS